jgi:flagellar FliL protein
MNKKIVITVVVALAAGGFAAKTFLIPKPKVKPAKIAGAIYVLPKGFTFNLADNKYATLTLALVLPPGESDGESADATTTPAGFGPLPEEPVIRAIVTNLITSQPASALLSASGRARLQSEIMADIARESDVKVDQVLFTDLAVQ